MPLLSYATASVAAGLLGTSISRLAVTGLRSARAGLRTQTERNEQQYRLRRETQHARLASELNWQTASSPNAAWRVVEVMEVADESDDCRSFYLRDPSGRTLPAFQPGQFVAVRPALGGNAQPTRCYSLSDSPSQAWWRISVKRVQAGPTLSQIAGSGLSAWLHERARVGDYLLVHGPSGHFTIDTASNSPIAFLAAGIGITPIISMLKHVLEVQANRPVKLFFQAQDESHWPFGRTLHTWQVDCPSLSVTSTFSRASTVPKVEGGQVALGRLDAHSVIAAFQEPRAAQFYLCGPDAWMASMMDDLIANGIAREQLHSESFGTGPANHPAAEAIAADPWSLRFTQSGLQVAANTEPKSIWQAAKEQGLELPAACHTGACGTCRIKLRSGSVRYQSEPSGCRAADEVLACVAQPVGDVVVDA